MIEIRLLRNALMLAKHKNFARAAVALNISQPTLSRSIQQLEVITGERLFDRASRSVLPTQAGDILLKHAKTIISSSKNLQEDIARHKGLLEGTLYIGSGPFPASALIAPVVSCFRKSYPGISVEISVDDWTKFPHRFTQEDFDFVVMESSHISALKDYELIRLNRHQGFFFCRKGHLLLEKNNLDISDLSAFPFVFNVLPDRLSGLLERLFFQGEGSNTHGRKIQNIFCNDLGTMKATVSHSDAISLGTYGALAPELMAGLFVALPFRVSELRTDYDIVKKSGVSLSPAAQSFAELLVIKDKEQSALEVDLINSLGPLLGCELN